MVTFIRDAGVDAFVSIYSGSMLSGVSGEKLNFSSTFNGSSYKVGASPISITFNDLQVGYTQPAVQTVTVLNFSSDEVELVQPVATNFDVGALPANRLAKGESLTFTLRPKAGLLAGNYNETINIIGNDDAKTTVRANFTVTSAFHTDGGSFGVPPAAQPAVPYHPSSPPGGPLGPVPMSPIHLAGTRVAAMLSSNTLILNSVQTVFPAYTIADYNWLKLRDMAALLNGTEKQFSVGWDPGTNTVSMSPGGVYSMVGDELRELPGEETTAISTLQRFVVGGQAANVAAYNIGGYNYFRLRDIAILLDFGVHWQGNGGVITLDLTRSYSE
jgi:hypothetical protein